MTASAYKYKHTSYMRSDSDSHHNYEYPSQELTGIRENRAYERMNTRSADISPASYSPNVPDDLKSAQLRIGDQTPTRTENESWKPYAESRPGQNTDKIVFLGLKAEEFQLEIPEHCQRLGFCEDIPNYPNEIAKKVISELPDLSMFQDDKLDLPDVPDITQRVESEEENIELCQFEEKTVYPKAATDSSGNWHLVLNLDDKLIQGFKVEICKNVINNDGKTSELEIKERKWQDLTKCSEKAGFIPGYEGRCKQKYVYRKMTVLHNGSNLENFELLRIPSCCSCVGKLTILDHW